MTKSQKKSKRVNKTPKSKRSKVAKPTQKAKLKIRRGGILNESDLRKLEKLLKSKKATYQDIQDTFSIDYRTALNSVNELKKNNGKLKEEYYEGKKQFWMPTTQEWEHLENQYTVPTDKDGKFKFALLSCTHMGSNHEMNEELHDFYDILDKENVKLALHAGDVFEGIKGSSRKRQLTELKFYGYQKFLDYGAKNYPKKKDIKTVMISGNHDNFFWDENGADIVQELANRREDIDYAGFEMADVHVNGLRIRLHHPGGGGAYARTYKLQRYLNEMQDKPDIYAMGHYHVNTYMHYCGTHAFMLGTFKGLDPFLARIGKFPDVGAWIVEVLVEEGRIKEISPKWVDYPDVKKR